MTRNSQLVLKCREDEAGGADGRLMLHDEWLTRYHLLLKERGLGVKQQRLVTHNKSDLYN